MGQRPYEGEISREELHEWMPVYLWKPGLRQLHVLHLWNLSTTVCIWFYPQFPTPVVHLISSHKSSCLPRTWMAHWWVVKGYHPVYDCYPCQQLLFHEINSTSWTYYTQYQVYLTNGTLKLVSLGAVIPMSQPWMNISFVYHDAGLVHNETWWLLDKANDGSFIAMYYCGNSLHWNYEGSLVLARNKTLSAQVYVNVTAAYQKGWTQKSFATLM